MCKQKENKKKVKTKQTKKVRPASTSTSSVKIADQHNSALFTTLVMLTDGTAVKTIERYEEAEDGVGWLLSRP